MGIRWTCFLLKDTIRNWDMLGGICWWKVPWLSLESGLRKLETDKDLLKLCKTCKRNHNVMNIFFEHGVSEPHVVECMSEEDDVILSTNAPLLKLPSTQPAMQATKIVSQPTIKELVWECARSRTVSDFERNMKRVKVLNERAWAYLDKWPKESWTKSHFREGPKMDTICNNTCESFNARTKHDRAKPILTLAKEIRRIIMKSMIDNRQKLANYHGILPPVQQSRLEAMTKLSQHWSPQWSGDQNEELYEVHGWPTTMVVDLGKRTCTCKFWQLTGMPCMHAISCIQDKNDKRAEEYCHEWLTMESYRKTYAFHVNPVKGQNLWEKTGCPAPVFPPIKPKPGRPTKNRRKDKDEGRSGSKTRIKKKYNPIRCMFYGEVGHNKRTCKMKKQAEAEEEARLMQLQLALTKPNTYSPNELPTDATDATPDNPIPLSVSPPPQRSNAATESTSAKVRERPPKLQVCKGKGKRAASPQPAPPTATTPISAGTIKGSSAATTKKLASFMTFVPTPGFKRPRKKDDAI